MQNTKKNQLKTFAKSLTLGEKRTFKNMAVIPLFFEQKPKTKYLTLGQAMKKGLVEVVEKSAGGSVPELKVINKDNKRVFLLDSEELAGAKQNRILNTSILLKKNSETIIPVSCTEAGRWTYESPTFKESGNVAAYSIRRNKAGSVSDSLKVSNKFNSDQGEVWADIDEHISAFSLASPTRAMKDVFDENKDSIEDYIKSFPFVKGQKGFIVLINGKIAGMDFLSSCKAFKKLYKKILKSYAVEARLKAKEGSKEVKDDDIKDFIKKTAKAETSRFKSVGHGYDNRISGKNISGNMLTYKGEIIHLAVFNSKRKKKTTGYPIDPLVNDHTILPF